MTLGVLSDTHGELLNLQRALKFFKERGVATLLHAGDFGEAELVREFQGFTLYLSKGNCDFLEQLRPEFEKAGQPQPRISHNLEFENKSLLLMHGDDVFLYRDAIAKGGYDYLIKGHTHFAEDYVRGETRVLNPGALHRSDRYTVGLLEPASGNWSLQEI